MAETFPNVSPNIATPGESMEFRVLEAPFGDGYLQTAIDGINNEVRQWELVWIQSRDVIETLRSFLRARAGLPFLWTPTDDPAPVLVRCLTYNRQLNGPNATLTAQFQRWYGPTP